MQFGFKKQEKLKSKKLIATLFDSGEKLSNFPILLLYKQTDHSGNYPVQAGFTVSKKNIKNAVDRNRIKRLLREVYRLNKPSLYERLQDTYIFMFIYLDKKEEKHEVLDKKMKELFHDFLTRIQQK